MFETHREIPGADAGPQLLSASPAHPRVPLHDLDEFSLGGGAAPEGAAPDACGAFALLALEDDLEWRLASGFPLPTTLL